MVGRGVRRVAPEVASSRAAYSGSYTSGASTSPRRRPRHLDEYERDRAPRSARPAMCAARSCGHIAGICERDAISACRRTSSKWSCRIACIMGVSDLAS